MITKISKKLMLGLIVITTMVPVFADSGSSNTSNNSTNGGALLDLLAKDPKTKRVPSRNYLEIVYSYGMLTLSSNVYEGEFSFCFDNIETGESVIVPSIYVGESINIELPYGVYNVIATGSDSLSFYGCLEIS